MSVALSSACLFAPVMLNALHLILLEYLIYSNSSSVLLTCAGAHLCTMEIFMRLLSISMQFDSNKTTNQQSTHFVVVCNQVWANRVYIYRLYYVFECTFNDDDDDLFLVFFSSLDDVVFITRLNVLIETVDRESTAFFT